MPEQRTMNDLLTMQAWPLDRKISVTQTRLVEWVQRYNGEIYISFSGGKDSTVLADLAARVYKATQRTDPLTLVFVNTVFRVEVSGAIFVANQRVVFVAGHGSPAILCGLPVSFGFAVRLVNWNAYNCGHKIALFPFFLHFGTLPAQSPGLFR